MNVLVIDCSGEVLSVGVGRNFDARGKGPTSPKHPFREESGHSHAPGPGFTSLNIDLGFRHAERIMGAVEYCIKEAGLLPDQLDLLACTGGPGSFTGLRIGLATIKGLSLGLGVPFVLVPTLDVLAADWEGASPVLVPILDAKRSHFYFAVYEHGTLVHGPMDDGLERILSLTHAYAEVLFVGPGADMLEQTVAERSGFRVVTETRRSPVIALAKLAVTRFLEMGPSPADCGLLYLRPSDAEENSTAQALASIAGKP